MKKCVSSVIVVCLTVLLSAHLGIADPVPGTWSWGQALIKINTLSSSVTSSCRVWLEKYGTSAYRVWKRCGVGSVASGSGLSDIYFTSSAGPVVSGIAAQCVTNGCVVWGKDGSGQLTSAGRNPVAGDGSFPANQPTCSGLFCQGAGNGTDVENAYSFTCTGAIIAGGAVNVQHSSPGLIYSLSGAYLRDTSASVNTVSASCTGSDSLVYDFGEVAQTCSEGVTVSAVVGGHESTVGSCTCPPIGYAITSYVAPNSCSFKGISGDPGHIADPTPSVVGTQKVVAGSTFTNNDLTSMGATQIPIAGSSGTGGIADGYGITGAQGGATPGTAPGGSGPGPGGIGGTGSGSGSGSGSGNCPVGVQNCNGDGSVDVYSTPGAVTYDSVISGQPTEDSPTWVEQIQSFVSSSPVVTAITGSGVTASGDCALSTTVMGATVDLGFCNIPSSFFSVMSVALLLVAHLVAFFIIFR